MAKSPVQKKFEALVTEHLRDIAKERTEVGKDDGGIPTLITKGEALARQIWNMALGYKYHTHVGGKMVEKYSPPDKTMVQLILERTEGKVATAVDDGPEKEKLPDRISDLRKERLNAMAKDAARNSTTTEDTVS